jgi:hypothetical protein
VLDLILYQLFRTSCVGWFFRIFGYYRRGQSTGFKSAFPDFWFLGHVPSTRDDSLSIVLPDQPIRTVKIVLSTRLFGFWVTFPDQRQTIHCQIVLSDRIDRDCPICVVDTIPNRSTGQIVFVICFIIPPPPLPDNVHRLQ